MNSNNINIVNISICAAELDGNLQNVIFSDVPTSRMVHKKKTYLLHVLYEIETNSGC